MSEQHISFYSYTIIKGLVTNYRERGYKTGGGKFYPYEKGGGGGKGFGHAEGGVGGTTSFGVVFTQ